MSYSEPLINQLKIFLLSVGFGFLEGIYYDTLGGLLMPLSRNRKWILFCDLLFGITASVASFFFIIFINSGKFRLHLAFGIILGAIATHISFSRLIYKILSFPMNFIKKIFYFLKNIVKSYLKNHNKSV